MKIYLVGGAVRDELLGIPSKEKDWVVVDSSHQEMTKNGFKRVGKNFKGVLGISIGKNKQTSLDNAYRDYRFCMKECFEVADYIDLGTWPEIRRLLIDYEKDNN